MIALLKAVHIPALLIWSAGLLYLPALLLAHCRATDATDLTRLLWASRFAHTGIMSPAGFVAIGSGTALLFVAPAFEGWMFLKLALVWCLVVVHLRLAAVVRALSADGRRPPRLRLLGLSGAVLAAIGGILWLVLAEPSIPADRLPDWMLEPGGLQRKLRFDTPIPFSNTN